MKVPILCKIDASVYDLVPDKSSLEEILLLGLCNFNTQFILIENYKNIRLEIELGILKELQFISRKRESYPGIVAGEIILSFILNCEKIYFFS